MKGRRALALVGSSLVLSAIACVDLFHDTDFETLCSSTPNDPACGNDAGVVKDGAAEAEVGVDASRARPDFCAWDAAEARAQAMRACAWLGACEGPLGESAFGPCVVRAMLAFDCTSTPTLRPAGEVDAFWGCLATVASCADVDQCVFPGGVQPCKEVSAGSSTACGTLAANAGARLRCSGPAGRAAGVEPCTMLGKTCAVENASTSTCAGALGFDTCSTNLCSGKSAVDCQPAGTRTLDRGVSCAGIGAGQCITADAGAPFCQPTAAAPSCTEDTEPACEGQVLTSCVENRQTRIDCGRIGLPCDVSTAPPSYDLAAACIDRAGTCAQPIDVCVNAGKLRSCGRGIALEVECASVGLGPCKVDANGLGTCAAP